MKTNNTSPIFSDNRKSGLDISVPHSTCANNDLDKMADLAETVSSAKECTGLVARAPQNEDEYENYMSLMKFSQWSLTEKIFKKQICLKINR